MGNYTNEKSLVVVQNNFLNKIKSFFAKAFWNRKSKYEMIEDEAENINQDYVDQFEQQEPVQKERRLYNFDADNNDNWPGDGNMNLEEKNENDNVNMNSADTQNNNENNEYNEQNDEIQYEKEEYSQAYIEKQELEQKLLNYYESIKKGI